MQYRLHTLLILLAVGPMLFGGIFHAARISAEAREKARRAHCDNRLFQWSGPLPPGYDLPMLKSAAKPPPTEAAATDSASESVRSVEWPELAFTVQDRKTFDESQIPDRVRALKGKRIRLRGFIHPSVTSSEPSEFVLVGEIKGQPTVYRPRSVLSGELPIDQLAVVKLEHGKSAKFTLKPVAVTGRLEFEVQKLEGEAVLVFRLVADSVVEVPSRPGYGRALGDGC
jgi:hypothetical protein